MADVFLSYARDQAHAAALSKLLQIEMGLWSVFWDRNMPPGLKWEDQLAKELMACGCVVVLWSAASVHSPWVVTEARIGRQRNILVPAQLDYTNPPAEFQDLQTAQLQKGLGHFNMVEIGMLTMAITNLVGVTPPSLNGPHPQAASIAKDMQFRTLYPNVGMWIAVGLTPAFGFTRQHCVGLANSIAQDFSNAVRKGATPYRTLSHLQGAIRAYFDQRPQDLDFLPRDIDVMRTRFHGCQTPDDFHALFDELKAGGRRRRKR